MYEDICTHIYIWMYIYMDIYIYKNEVVEQVDAEDTNLKISRGASDMYTWTEDTHMYICMCIYIER